MRVMTTVCDFTKKGFMWDVVEGTFENFWNSPEA